MELKNLKLIFLLKLVAGLGFVLLLAAWGATGHRIINTDVMLHLPPSMQFFVRNASFLTQHASDADGRKGGDNKKPYILKEGPRHFIDIDSYPEFASKSVPESFNTVIARYDSATVFSYGVVPWAAVWTLDSLTTQLKRGDTLDALQSAADLGHYVGDAHQPLHNTKDYDGRSSVPGSNGIHSRYETTMINNYQSQITVQADTVQYIANPIDFMFSIVYRSNSYVDSLYAADAYAQQVSGGHTSQTYYDTLWSRTKGFTQLQFQRATIDYADLLYTAWVNAESSGVANVAHHGASSVVPEHAWLGQNFPNPFNPSTNISFKITETAHVTLSVYSLQGRRIAVLLDRSMSAGSYESKFDASSLSLSSGLYLYRLQIQSGHSSKTLTNKMVLLK
jgi:hypothetical protein